MLDASVERQLIIDASALLAFLHREPGGYAVGEMVADPQNRCWIHVVNLCEVYYDLLRRKHQLADVLEIALRASGFKIARRRRFRQAQAPPGASTPKMQEMCVKFLGVGRPTSAPRDS